MDQRRREILLIGVGVAAATTWPALAQQNGAPTRPRDDAPGSPSVAAPRPATSTPPAATGAPASEGTPSWVAFVPIVGPVISGLIAFAGVKMGLATGERNTAKTIDAGAQASRASIWQKANEAELKVIQDKLEGFYGPFMQVSSMNRLLAGDLRVRLGRGAEFRLLLALLEEGWLDRLSRGDAAIVAEICGNAGRLEALVTEKAGAVDEALSPYLARAATHFRMLRRAHERLLGGDATPFERYVYPYQLDDVLALDVARLRRRAEQLRGTPAASAGEIEALSIPPGLTLAPWPDVPAR